MTGKSDSYNITLAVAIMIVWPAFIMLEKQVKSDKD